MTLAKIAPPPTSFFPAEKSLSVASWIGRVACASPSSLHIYFLCCIVKMLYVVVALVLLVGFLFSTTHTAHRKALKEAKTSQILPTPGAVVDQLLYLLFKRAPHGKHTIYTQGCQDTVDGLELWPTTWLGSVPISDLSLIHPMWWSLDVWTRNNSILDCITHKSNNILLLVKGSFDSIVN